MRVPVTVRHVFDFGSDRPLVGDDLVRPEAWDALRTRSSGAFAIPPDRKRWEGFARGRTQLVDRAAALDAWLRGQDVGSVASYGVGAAWLELLLFRANPDRRMVLSDYASATIERLSEIFPEVAVQRFDLRADWPLDTQLHLFHRIETELPNRAWRDVFGRFGRARILVIADELLGVHRAVFELRRRRDGRNLTRAGWLRNRAAMERLWAPTHRATRLRMHGAHAWDLRPTSA